MKKIAILIFKFCIHPVTNLIVGTLGLILMGIYTDFTIGLSSLDRASVFFGAFYVIFLSIFDYGLILLYPDRSKGGNE